MFTCIERKICFTKKGKQICKDKGYKNYSMKNKEYTDL